jgi:adenosylcobinamide kinase/adenosylcobinamide-phosphate guanylyltransferase
VSRLALVGGGARSGKSAFALARARAFGPRRTFVATAQALDREMRERIARHIEERGGSFETVEAPFELSAAVASLRDVDAVVIDCLTLWLSNLLVRGDGPDRIEDQVDALVRTLVQAPFHVVLVTNEVGMGVVPESALGRVFRDLAGRTHQRIAARADEIYAAMLGCIVRLRPAPVALEGGQ